MSKPQSHRAVSAPAKEAKTYVTTKDGPALEQKTEEKKAAKPQKRAAASKK